MKLTNEERQGLVAGIIANCDCWKAQGDDRTLNTFSDEKLVTLKEHIDKEKQAIVVANSAVRGFSDGETAYRVNPETGDWERKVNKPTANKKKAPPEDDEEEDDEEEEGYTAENSKRMAGKKTPAANERRPRTADEWWRNAPPEVQAERAYAQQLISQKKHEIINKLLVNVVESERQVHRERLMGRTPDELQADLDMMPKVTTQDQIDQLSGQTTNRRGKRREMVDNDMLGIPQMSWEKVDGDGKQKPVQSQVANDEFDDGQSDEDWIKTAPAHVRELVKNAAAIESEERAEIIASMTANFQGTDEQEAVLVNQLRGMKLQQLRNLQALTPRRETKSNFFGAAAPVSNARGSSTDVNEDVLPLPTTDWKANAAM